VGQALTERSTISQHRRPIPPVAGGEPRPRWSVMIPTYNCAHLLSETLASVLAQDLGSQEMQIEVVDDCSTRDDPEAVVAELGQGRVGFHRQPRNVGHTANFDTCIERSRGHLVHLLHGDDVVRPGFYRRLERGLVEHPEVGAAFCRHILADEQGHWRVISRLEQPAPGVLDGWLERIAIGQLLQPPAMVVRRSLYEHLGGFDRRIRQWSEDWEMWLRIAAHHPVWYEPEPLAVYRMRSGSLTSGAVSDGSATEECCRIVSYAGEYLPAALHARTAPLAREECVVGGYRRLRRRLDAGDRHAVTWPQIRAALRCSRSARVLLHTGLLCGAALRARAQAG